MTDKELMQMAFKAMDSVNDFSSNSIYAGIFDWEVKILRDRLAQPNEFNPDWDAMAVIVEEQQRMAKRIAELEAQLEQEPVAWVAYENGEKHGIDFYEDEIAELPVGTLLYTAPPQREWVGLTDEEKEHYRRLGLVGVEIIEAKLKEKNT